jgi:hypothetical protein
VRSATRSYLTVRKNILHPASSPLRSNGSAQDEIGPMPFGHGRSHLALRRAPFEKIPTVPTTALPGSSVSFLLC